jgi:hypothetical protein
MKHTHSDQRVLIGMLLLLQANTKAESKQPKLVC